MLISPIIYRLSCSAHLCSLHRKICLLAAAGLVELLNRPHIDKSVVPAHLPFQSAVEPLFLLFFAINAAVLNRISAQIEQSSPESNKQSDWSPILPHARCTRRQRHGKKPLAVWFWKNQISQCHAPYTLAPRPNPDPLPPNGITLLAAVSNQPN